VTTGHRLFAAGAVERRKQRLDRVAYAVGFTAASLLIVPLAAIVGYLVVKAWPALSWELVTQNPSRFMTAGGLWAPLVGTAYVVIFSLAMAAPVGDLAGIYLKEYAGDTWLTRAVYLAVMNLAGIPSIVHALFGVGVFVLAAGWGRSVLAASCTLAIMTLPVIITSTVEAPSPPMTFREACWNLGASRWQTIRTLVLPNAMGASSLASSCRCRELPAKPLRFSSPALFLSGDPETGLAAYFYGVRIRSWRCLITCSRSPVRSRACRIRCSATAVVLMGLVLVVNLVSIAARYRLRSRSRW
jgi:phosphate transport system permease protein